MSHSHAHDAPDLLRQTIPSDDESAFSYWKRTCALHHAFHTSRIPFVKPDIREFFDFVDDLVTTVQAAHPSAEAALNAKLAQTPSDWSRLAAEFDELYHLSVEQWHQSMKKLRSFSSTDSTSRPHDRQTLFQPVRA